MSKNVLTNQIQSDRIVKLSQDRTLWNMAKKKLEKSLKKYLTNEFHCVKLLKLPQKREADIIQKNFWKTSKKVLTKEE